MQRGRRREDARRGPRIEPPAAILAAGGRGERASDPSQDQPKQFRLLAGRPLLTWSLEALDAFGCDPVVLVVPPERVETAHEVVRDFQRVVVTSGGDSRQESVARGLEHVRKAEFVVVHDAARPFLTVSLLERVVGAIGSNDGAIAAEPVEETLKTVHDERIVKTLDRSRVWRAQTPQAFRTNALRRAHERSPDVAATDDAQLIELAGGQVAVVRGDRRNVKITFDEDFTLAESLATRVE